jgi:mannosyl-3-phosphoglycerate phosphatase
MHTGQFVVFTDLDGTLLDRETYSPREALPAVELLLNKETPIVFCSSKTRKEQELYRKQLSINDPFIVEDGGAVFSPRSYFPFPADYAKHVNGYDVIELGTPYAQIRTALQTVQSELNLEIVGYGDLSAAEVSSLTGLSEDAAVRAKQREYQETVVSRYSEQDLDRLDRALKKRGLVLSPAARFMGVGGATDKGIAVDVLTTMYRLRHLDIHTVGIGDSFNDIPLFLSVDIPVLVQQPDGTWAPIPMEGLHRIKGIGPAGWNDFVMEWFS